PVEASLIGAPCDTPAPRLQPLDRTMQCGGGDADLGEAELSARRVLQAQILYVDAQLPELSEEAAELAGGVVDHDDELLEAAVLPVLARQSLDAVVALADRLGHRATRTGSRRGAQRVRDRAQV